MFNPDGICVAQEVQADAVGRNVNEFLRQIQAWQMCIRDRVYMGAQQKSPAELVSDWMEQSLTTGVNACDH